MERVAEREDVAAAAGEEETAAEGAGGEEEEEEEEGRDEEERQALCLYPTPSFLLRGKSEPLICLLHRVHLVDPAGRGEGSATQCNGREEEVEEE